MTAADNSNGDGLGLVVGTVPATPLTFSVSLAPGQYAQLDDVVVTSARCRRPEPVQISGVVTMSRRARGCPFDSDVFLISEGVLPAEVIEVAEVTDHPGRAGDLRAAATGRRGPKAAGAERDQPCTSTRWSGLPIGLGRDGEPLFVNFEFIDGTRGAHVNISGISGVATKTTYATFLLYSHVRLAGSSAPKRSTPRR